jgi:tetratricopeptide (TPR) repeat protein
VDNYEGHPNRARSMHGERDRLDEGIRLERSGQLARALEVYDNVAATTKTPAIAAESMRRKSDVYRQQCDWDAALKAARESAQTALRAGLPELFAEALNAEAAVYLSRGDFVAARPLLEQILVIVTDDRILGIARQNLGNIAAQDRKLDVAREHFRRSREHFARAGYKRGEAIALINQAAIANLSNDYEGALEAAEEATEQARELGDFELIALAAINQAEALAGLDRLTEAESLASQALGFFGIEGNRYRQVGCLRVLGDICRKQKRYANAVRCYERALKMAEGIDAHIERVMLEDRLADLEGLAYT